MTPAVFDWVTARSELGTWLGEVTGLHVMDIDGSQDWGGSLREDVPLFADAYVRLVVTRPIGTDEVRRVYVDSSPQGEEIELHIHGLREMVWEIRFESRDSSSGKDAASYAEMVRALVHDRSAKWAFSRSGLGLRKVSATMNLSALQGDRVVSAVQIDVAFHAHTKTVGSKYGYIDTIYGRSEWRDPNGDLYSDEFQYDGELT